jgi:hypothetical protein
VSTEFKLKSAKDISWSPNFQNAAAWILFPTRFSNQQDGNKTLIELTCGYCTCKFVGPEIQTPDPMDHDTDIDIY